MLISNDLVLDLFRSRALAASTQTTVYGLYSGAQIKFSTKKQFTWNNAVINMSKKKSDSPERKTKAS